MTTVKGAIDVLDNTQVSGWVTGDDAGNPRFIRILIDGVEIGTALADHFRSDLKEKKISDGRSGFRHLFARFLDPLVDHDIRIEDRDTGAAVGKGNVKLPSIISAANSEHAVFGLDRDFVVLNIGEASLKDGIWTIDLRAIGPIGFNFGIACEGATVGAFKISELDNPFLRALGLKRLGIRTTLTPDPNARHVALKLIEETDLAKRFRPVGGVAFPAEMPDYLTGLSAENMTRVSGPNTTTERFATIGFSTAYRLNEILKAHFGREFRDLGNCLDWGIGAGRVAVPIKHFFAPELALVGADIDAFNVEFGQRNHPDIKFIRSRLFPPLPFADEFFDAIYGISVFTHLTEGAQIAWLEELRRLVKPGSPVIVTVHSELSMFDVSRLRSEIISEVSKYGLSDSTMDGNLGPKLEAQTYYRATFHGRKYILSTWSKYFEILKCYTCANVDVQDYIVMRAR